MNAPHRRGRARTAPVTLAGVALLLLLAAGPPAAAQQPADSARSAPAAAGPAAPDSLAAPGPRREDRWQPWRPDFLKGAAAAGAQEGRMHTIRLSTLAIVLIGVILLLLIVR